MKNRQTDNAALRLALSLSKGREPVLSLPKRVGVRLIDMRKFFERGGDEVKKQIR
jgi:hypothetical protein